MSDGFKMKIDKPKDENAWKRSRNRKALRAATAKYLSIEQEEEILSEIGSKEGPVANIMRRPAHNNDELKRSVQTAVVSTTRRKGGMIAVRPQVLKVCDARKLPLRVYLEGISQQTEWRFYEFDADEVLLDEETHTEDGWTWYRLPLGTAYGVKPDGD